MDYITKLPAPMKPISAEKYKEMMTKTKALFQQHPIEIVSPGYRSCKGMMQ